VEHEVSPPRLKWRLQCTGQVDMDVAREFTFDSPEHYSATIAAGSFMQGHPSHRTCAVDRGTARGECRQSVPKALPALRKIPLFWRKNPAKLNLLQRQRD
jgi:hypothetical protein